MKILLFQVMETMVPVLVFSSWNKFLFWVDAFFFSFYFGLYWNDTGQSYYFLLSSKLGLNKFNYKLCENYFRSLKKSQNCTKLIIKFLLFWVSFQNKMRKKSSSFYAMFTELFQVIGNLKPTSFPKVAYLPCHQDSLSLLLVFTFDLKNNLWNREWKDTEEDKVLRTVFTEVPKIQNIILSPVFILY